MAGNLQPAFILENFIDSWNGDYPNYPLTAADLKKPQAVFGALLQVFNKLGIDGDSVVAPPPEENRNENTIYYWDLLPVINMTRVINHLVSVMPQLNATVTIIHFLQPTITTSRSILLVLFNLMLFKKERLSYISIYEEEQFSKTDQVKALEDEKNKMLVMLNKQAEEKGNRAERFVKLNVAIKQYEEEFEQEKKKHTEESLQLEAVQKDIAQAEMLLEQKKNFRNTLVQEVVKKRAFRVYDADDIKAKREKAAQNVLEAEKDLNSLQAMLIQGENNLKNLQTIQPTLDTANNLLNEIMKFSDSLKDVECGDLESDDNEIYILTTELNELQAKLREIETTSAEETKKRHEAQAKRQQDMTTAQSLVREAIEKDKKLLERRNKSMQRIEELKEASLQYEFEKRNKLEQIIEIKEHFCTELKSINDILLKQAAETVRIVNEKLQNRHN